MKRARLGSVFAPWVLVITSPLAAQESAPPETTSVPADQTAPQRAAPMPQEEPGTCPDAKIADELQRSFYKGDLGTAGAPELENPNDAVFMGIGYYNIGGVLGTHYAHLSPALDLHLKAAEEKTLVLRFEAPMNFVAYDAHVGGDKKPAGQFRKQDYDEVGDFLKVIKQIQLGRKEERVYLNVGLLHGASVGHGTVVRRYNANIDPDRTRLGFQFDAYNDYGGVETFVADLAMQSRVMGALGFVKPLSFFTCEPVSRTFSLGVHYTADLNAPKSLSRTGQPGATQPLGAVEVDAAGYPEFASTTVGITGIDMEVKPVKIGNAFDLKVYADYSQIITAGGGVTGGVLLRSNLGARPWLNAFRVRGEARRYANNFVPAYFDSLYEVQKFQLVSGEPTGTEPTKYEAIVKAKSGPMRTSVYGEASYALVDELVAGLGLERNIDARTYNLLVHLEVPAFEFLRLYASYQRLGFDNLAESFALAKNGRSFASNSILYSQARLMILPILFVNAGVQQTFQWDADFKGGSYRPRLNLIAEAQLGWEFDKEEAQAEPVAQP